MSDTLKDFIANNRAGFDDLVPGELWTKIGSSVQSQTSYINLKKITNMFKYGFGASVLVTGTILLVNSQKTKVDTLHQNKAIVIDSPNTLFRTPKINAGAVILTERKKEQKPDTLPKKTEIKETEKQPFNEQTSYTHTGVDTLVVQNQNGSAMAWPSYKPVKTKDPDSLETDGYMLTDTMFNGIKKIEVKVEFCNVNVKGVNGAEVNVHSKISNGSGRVLMLGKRAYKKSEYKLKFEKQDSVLKVWMENIKVHEKMCSCDVDREESVIDFEVPVKTTLEVSTQSGNIMVSGLKSKYVTLQTSFGDINANNINASLTAKSSSGNITLKGIEGEIKTASSFGDQVIEGVIGNIKLHSSSGNIIVKQLTGNAELKSSFGYQRCDSVTGNITSVVSSGNIIIKHLKGNITARSSFGTQNFENIEGDVNSKASSGDIKLNGLKGLLFLSTSFGDIKGKNISLMNSANFHTSSGDIQIAFLNDMKELSFDLQSSSGKLLVEKDNIKNSSEEKLVISQGPILVKGVSSFGDQSYR